MGCVPLLPWRLLIFVKNPVNELFHRSQFRLLPPGFLALRRNRTLQCLTHHTPVHLMLLSQLANGLSRRVAAADHLEQFQFGSPFHLRQDGKPPSPGCQGGAKSDHQMGPNQSIELTRPIILPHVQFGSHSALP